MSNTIAPGALAHALTDLSSPRIIAEINDSYVKVAKVKGMFDWHSHDTEDELFYILKGKLRIDMESGAVELNEGEAFVVPKGIRHCPSAEQECHIILIERKSTLHTGTEITAHTRRIEEQLRPL